MQPYAVYFRSHRLSDHTDPQATLKAVHGGGLDWHIDCGNQAAASALSQAGKPKCSVTYRIRPVVSRYTSADIRQWDAIRRTIESVQYRPSVPVAQVAA